METPPLSPEPDGCAAGLPGAPVIRTVRVKTNVLLCQLLAETLHLLRQQVDLQRELLAITREHFNLSPLVVNNNAELQPPA